MNIIRVTRNNVTCQINFKTGKAFVVKKVKGFWIKQKDITASEFGAFRAYGSYSKENVDKYLEALKKREKIKEDYNTSKMGGMLIKTIIDSGLII